MSEARCCEICDNPLKANAPDRQLFCSTKCKGNAYHRARKGLPMKLIYLKCEVCDRNFFQKRSNNLKYCTKACKKLAVARAYHGREVNGPLKHVKGSGYITTTGYKMISRNHPNATIRSPTTGKGQIMEHVWIMSEHIGRPLFAKETVHHKNGIRDDNRIENLELWSHSHPPGQRVEDKIKWCKEFLEQYKENH